MSFARDYGVLTRAKPDQPAVSGPRVFDQRPRDGENTGRRAWATLHAHRATKPSRVRALTRPGSEFTAWRSHLHAATQRGEVGGVSIVEGAAR